MSDRGSDGESEASKMKDRATDWMRVFINSYLKSSRQDYFFIDRATLASAVEIFRLETCSDKLCSVTICCNKLRVQGNTMFAIRLP